MSTKIVRYLHYSLFDVFEEFIKKPYYVKKHDLSNIYYIYKNSAWLRKDVEIASIIDNNASDKFTIVIKESQITDDDLKEIERLVLLYESQKMNLYDNDLQRVEIIVYKDQKCFV